MTTGRLILCAGVPRSGSTWLFNAARILLERVGPVRGFWIDDYLAADDRDAPTGGALLIKLHAFDAALADRAETILTSRRDLVEVAASAARLGWATGDDELTAFVDGVVWKHEAWRGVSDYELAYERLAAHAADEVMAVAEALDIPIGPDDAEGVTSQIAAQRYTGAEGTYDPRTLLHPGHVAAMRPSLSAAQVALIREGFAGWQRSYGYPA